MIGSDTEMTYGGIVKTQEAKIRTLVANNGTTLIVTGSGHWDFVRMAIEKFARV
jgi:hypothetical protein